MYTIFLVAIDFRIFRRRLQGSKPIGLKSSLYHWKTIETQMFKMGLHDPFIMAKRKAGSEGGVRHTIGKILTKATTLLYTSFQSEVYTQSYGAPKLRESQLQEFRDSHLDVGIGIESHLDTGLVKKHIVYYKGEGGWFRQVRIVMNLVNPSLPVTRPNTKSVQTMH